MTESMYDKYGGFETVSKIVHGLYEKITASEILQSYFIDADMQRLMNHQTLFFSSIMKGPISYEVDQLEKIHSSFNITEEAFIEFYELLEEVFEDFEMKEVDIDEFMKIVRDIKSQIVQQ